MSWLLDGPASGSVLLRARNVWTKAAVWLQVSATSESPAPASIAVAVRAHVASQEIAAGSVLSPVTREALNMSGIDRLYSLRDRFAGERIFVMGNGPGLNRTPLANHYWNHTKVF